MFDVDPLDDTKAWPEDIFPLQPVGRMMFNKSPDNFFNEYLDRAPESVLAVAARTPKQQHHAQGLAACRCRRSAGGQTEAISGSPQA
ncbi:TPA: hypothetical protein ACH3X3_003905 [Trebouxia sp. C0006]